MISRAAQSDKKASDKKGLSEKVVEVVKVNRYRPGVKPQFAGEGEQADDDEPSFLGGSSSSAPVDRRMQRIQQAGGCGVK